MHKIDCLPYIFRFQLVVQAASIDPGPGLLLWTVTIPPEKSLQFPIIDGKKVDARRRLIDGKGKRG